MPHDAIDAFRRFDSKMDSRLTALLAMGPERRSALRDFERSEMRLLATNLREASRAVRGASKERRPAALKRLKGLHASVFGPITTGLMEPGDVGASSRLEETHLSAFVVSGASARDLTELGVQVRSQAGDIFTVFIPLSVLPKVLESPSVRYVELARPMFPTVNVAVQLAQIDQLRTPPSNYTGLGTIVGVVDTKLDIYHPDFRDAADKTRVRFLWDQTLTALASEHAPDSQPYGGAIPTPSYGVEYGRNDIDRQLAAGGNAYALVRHNSSGEEGAHGTAVAGIAVGNGRASPPGTPPNVGAAPGAELIFVAHPDLYTNEVLADITQVADAFRYVFERATQLNLPCVVNMSNGDNLGPHDGTSCGELFLDSLLELPGRAITLSAGNSTGTRSHVRGPVAANSTTSITLTCHAGAVKSDAVQVWYDGQDRFDATVTVPTAPSSLTATPGETKSLTWGGFELRVRSGVGHPGNGDNFIDVLFIVPPGGQVPPGDVKIDLHGSSVMNGAFHAWVDRNNRPADWSFVANNPPKLHFSANPGSPVQVDDAALTLGSPGTARRPITVGNHDQAMPPAIAPDSGRGPTRDGRIKPEIAAVGQGVTTTYSLNRNQGPYAPEDEYGEMDGTSASAPLVAGACAALFQCRGPTTTWAQLKQIFEDTAGTGGMTIPNNAFGFGYVQIGNGCSIATPQVDVWIRDDAGDAGQEPFTGAVAWLSPDIEVLDMSGNPVPNPTHVAGNALNNIVRVTVRNRGAQTARNTEVYLYWADPATNLPYPGAWNVSGIYKDVAGAGFLDQHNCIVIPQLAAGQSTKVEFAWAPPAPGANIRGDDHFCLLVRLENQADPSGLGTGGWNTVATRNNIALRNLHVQSIVGNAPVRMPFFAVGSSDQDSLVVTPDLVGGEVALALSLRALPWRDRAVADLSGGHRPPFADRRMPDPLAGLRRQLDADEAERLTGIRNARGIVVADGVALVTLDGSGRPLVVPDVRLENGACIVCSVLVVGAQVSGTHRFVHVAQRSGGRLVGGVSLELR